MKKNGYNTLIFRKWKKITYQFNNQKAEKFTYQMKKTRPKEQAKKIMYFNISKTIIVLGIE